MTTVLVLAAVAGLTGLIIGLLIWRMVTRPRSFASAGRTVVFEVLSDGRIAYDGKPIGTVNDAETVERFLAEASRENPMPHIEFKGPPGTDITQLRLRVGFIGDHVKTK